MNDPAPKPWDSAGTIIRDAEGTWIASPPPGYPEKDWKHVRETIVRRVNAFDELVAACDYAEQFCDCARSADSMRTIGKRLRAAL